MHDTMQTSNAMVADLVRAFFGVEPATMASLAHGNAVVRTRYEPEDGPTTEPLDGVEVLLRRAVALCWKLRDHHGAVMLVTERQAAAAGWPCAALANRCVLFAWTLSLTMRVDPASPLLLEPDERAGDAMVPLIRFGDGLPALGELLIPYYSRPSVDHDARERAADARQHAPVITGLRIASVQELFTRWFSIDANADAANLACNVFSLRMTGPDARAVHACIWIVTATFELGADMKAEAVRAVRLRTEYDAWLAVDPGATAANLAVLLGLAISNGGGHLPRLLPPADGYAAATDEACRRARHRREREGGGGEVGRVEILELEDIAARGYVHVGRIAASRVAWRQVRGDV